MREKGAVDAALELENAHLTSQAGNRAHILQPFHKRHFVEVEYIHGQVAKTAYEVLDGSQTELVQRKEPNAQDRWTRQCPGQREEG